MPTIDINKYLLRKHNMRSYNCWHLVLDCISEYHNETYPDYTPSVITRDSLVDQFTNDRIGMFIRIHPSNKQDGDIVYMTHPIHIPHVGFLYKNKVLSMKRSGPTYENILNASRGFKQLEYYRCKN